MCVCVCAEQLNSPMNSVSSSEDIKPPVGLNGVMKVPAQPCNNPLSLTKHICAICGDRSSGETQPHTHTHNHTHTHTLKLASFHTYTHTHTHILMDPQTYPHTHALTQKKHTHKPQEHTHTCKYSL